MSPPPISSRLATPVARKAGAGKAIGARRAIGAEKAGVAKAGKAGITAAAIGRIATTIVRATGSVGAASSSDRSGTAHSPSELADKKGRRLKLAPLSLYL